MDPSQEMLRQIEPVADKTFDRTTAVRGQGDSEEGRDPHVQDH
jgi:hypothetical protein